MHTKTLVTAAVFGALLAACDKAADPAAPANRGSSSGASQPATPQSTTPTTPANLPKPTTMEERREGANPTQGQVDPKEGEQRRGFQQSGDAKGPTSPETQAGPSTGSSTSR